MSMCVLGLSNELAKYAIAVNALWPRTIIATEALNVIAGSREQLEQMKMGGRRPEIVADAAAAILRKDSKTFTGNFCIDEDVLRRDCGRSDFSRYAVDPSAQLLEDLFVPNAKL